MENDTRTAELKSKLETLIDEMRDEGFSVVAVAVKYDESDTTFSTKLALTEIPDLGVTRNHIILDTIREISNSWSELAHE